MAMETLDFVSQHGGIWHLWGHSWEIMDANLLGPLEDTFRKLRERLPASAFVTNLASLDASAP